MIIRKSKFQAISRKKRRRVGESERREAGSRRQIERVKREIQVGKDKKKRAINCIFAGMLPKN